MIAPTRGQQVAGVCILMLLSFASGRFLAPTRVVEHDRIVHDQVSLSGDGTTTSGSNATAVDHTVEETKHPDGTTVVVKHDIVYRDVVKTVDVVHQVIVEKKSDQQSSSEISRPAPSWRIGVIAGLTTSSSRIRVNDLAPAIPGFLPLDAGVSLERRVAGPIWAGAWASSDKSAGVSLSIEF